MRILVSFDIDGTLEVGDPPGPITMDMVRKAQELGCIIGSSSDRSISAQQNMWDRNNIQVDFVSLKHMLSGIRERFEADCYYHTGDRDLDRQFAREAGFDFWWMHEAASEPWVAMANGQTPQ
ncbi:MAG: HAD family hydrolase [Chloroflexi bacterium]|nr:HAD family hydrolase [Chloroflexota bacterium]